MKHTLTYGDVISNGISRAMFLYYVWDYFGEMGKERPGQRVIMLTGVGPRFVSLRRGEVLTVNWLTIHGDEPDDFRVAL